jgi:hypothetical protein
LEGSSFALGHAALLLRRLAWLVGVVGMEFCVLKLDLLRFGSPGVLDVRSLSSPQSSNLLRCEVLVPLGTKSVWLKKAPAS